MIAYAPQIILLVVCSLMTGVIGSQHGETRKVDGWVVFTRVVILHLILWWGGWYASKP